MVTTTTDDATTRRELDEVFTRIRNVLAVYPESRWTVEEARSVEKALGMIVYNRAVAQRAAR